MRAMAFDVGQPGDRIVVGFDGSECSKGVLQWAAHQAQLTHARLEVVTAWESAFKRVAAVAAGHRDIIDSMQAAYSDVDIRPIVLVGRPAVMLTETANGAKLLVLGRSGHGALNGSLLGSVSECCVHYAPCPVVIIR